VRRSAEGAAALTFALAGVIAASAPARAESIGQLTVFAGTGARGSSGDGGPATQASFKYPDGIARTADGTVYISDMGNHTVRAVAPDGTVRTVAGTGEVPPTDAIQYGAPATRFPLASPGDLAAGPDGSLYIADIGMFRILQLTTDGHIRLVAGDGVRGYAGDGGPATTARIGWPLGMVVAGDGTLYFGDPDNQRVRRVAPDGTITTIAGNGAFRIDAAGGPATQIAVPAVWSLGLDHTGDLWMMDGSYLQRLSGGRIVTVTVTITDTRSGRLDGQTWGTSDATSWPPPSSPLAGVAAVATDGANVYVLTDDGLLRLGARQRLEQVADVGEHDFPPITAAAGAVYVVDPYANQVYVTHPAPPSATLAAPDTRSTPRWPFAAAGIAVLLVGVIVLGARRRRRRARAIVKGHPKDTYW